MSKPLIKPFWKSKTILFNFIGALILWILGHEVVGLDPGILATIQSIVNIILRFITTEPVSGGKKPIPNGFTKFTAMLICLFVSLVLVFLLTGCATFDKMYNKPKNLMCDQIEAKDSIICLKARQIGVEPEQMDALLLDATAIAVIIEPENKLRIAKFIDAIEEILTKTPLITFASLIGFVEEEKEKSELIAQIVARRLDWLKVDEYINAFDMNLILAHLEHQKSQLNLDALGVVKAVPLM